MGEALGSYQVDRKVVAKHTLKLALRQKRLETSRLITQHAGCGHYDKMRALLQKSLHSHDDAVLGATSSYILIAPATIQCFSWGTEVSTLSYHR